MADDGCSWTGVDAEAEAVDGAQLNLIFVGFRASRKLAMSFVGSKGELCPHAFS